MTDYELIDSAGTLTLLQPLDLQGGALAGDGTVAGDVNTTGTGALAPGASAGLLTIDGKLVQSGGGVLDVEARYHHGDPTADLVHARPGRIEPPVRQVVSQLESVVLARGRVVGVAFAVSPEYPKLPQNHE